MIVVTIHVTDEERAAAIGGGSVVKASLYDSQPWQYKRFCKNNFDITNEGQPALE